MGDIAITTRQVLHERWPILLVTHDADHGAWQFVNGHGDTRGPTGPKDRIG